MQLYSILNLYQKYSAKVKLNDMERFKLVFNLE